MRIFGAVLIVGAFSYIGFSVSGAMRRRARFWEEFIAAVQVLRTEICFAHTDMSRALTAAADAGCRELFGAAAENLESRGMAESWKEAVNALAMCGGDKAALIAMGAGLGRSGEEGQRRQTEYMAERAARIRDEAENEYERRGVLIRRGAVLLGALAAVALF